MSIVSLVPYYIAEFFSYGMAGGAGYLAWRVVRAYEYRSVEPARLASLAERITSLEDSVERVECRIEETVEAQRFTTHVLIGRAAGD
jgi:hypothetical protein